MRKFLCYFVLIQLTSLCFAETLSFFVEGSYCQIAMEDVNERLEEIRQNSFDTFINLIKQLGGSGSSSISKFKDGTSFSGGALYSLNEKMKAAAKISYFSSNPAQIKGDASVSIFNQVAEYHGKFNSFVDFTSVMLGYEYIVPQLKLGLGVGIYLGYAWANFEAKYSYETIGPNQQQSGGWKLPACGENFIGEGNLIINYNYSSTLNFFVKLGYRYAIIPEMKAKEDVSEINVKKGDTVKDENDETIKFDMSGMFFSVGMSFKL